MNNVTFGERIRLLMEVKGTTQKIVADELHICQTTFNGYVTDTHQPSFDIVIKLAHYFDTSCDYLLGNSGTQKAAPSEKDEAAIIDLYRIMTPDCRSLWMETGKLYCRELQ